MILGIGTDILKVSHLEHTVTAVDDPFVLATYTDKELALIRSRPIPLYSFATRFAGKEAVFKALSVHGKTIRLNEIEILENEVGVPVVTLHGKARQIAARKGIRHILLSLSYDTDYAIAYAAALNSCP